MSLIDYSTRASRLASWYSAYIIDLTAGFSRGVYSITVFLSAEGMATFGQSYRHVSFATPSPEDTLDRFTEFVGPLCITPKPHAI